MSQKFASSVSAAGFFSANQHRSGGSRLLLLWLTILSLLCAIRFAGAMSVQDYLIGNADSPNNNEAAGLLMSRNSATGSNRAIVEIDNAKEVAAFLQSLAQTIEDSRQGGLRKRGLDLGLSRGFSGSKAAKHLMGLASAQFANGPGKR